MSEMKSFMEGRNFNTFIIFTCQTKTDIYIDEIITNFKFYHPVVIRHWIYISMDIQYNHKYEQIDKNI